MRQAINMRQLLALILLFCVVSLPLVNAAVTDLPTLTTGTTAETGTTTGTTTGTKTTATNTGTTTGTTGTTTGTATGTTTGTATGTTSATSATGTSATTTGTSTGTTSGSVIHLSGVPTLEGVGIPTLVVPYTANAPYMQKSSLPEGTVFIAVGAVLAFLGFCVIAWRALVAWSINRSVKRAALASIMASETKNPGGWTSNPFKPAGGFYSQAPGGSVMSFSEPGVSGSKQRGAPFRNPIPSSGSGLFFSPTASSTNATQNIPMTGLPNQANRNSNFLPAGYYASPSSQVGGGAAQTTVGGGAPLYAQATGATPNPRLSTARNLAPPTNGPNRLSRPGSQGYLHPQASSSSLMVGTGHEDLPGSRAPSAYLEDLFEGNAPNESPRR